MEVAYDLSQSPCTYDFINFLVNAERARLARGEPSISLSFVMGERAKSNRDREFSYERRQWRIQSLLAQFPDLLPSITRTVMAGEGKQEFDYKQSSDYEPILKAPDGAMAAVSEYIRFGKPIVTVTLRNSDFQPERNSNLAEWVKVADWLGEQGYAVVFVPDTEAVIEGNLPAVGERHLYVPAAMSQSLRLALYEFATLNCFTSGGPMMLGLWSSAPSFLCSLVHEVWSSCSMAALDSVGLNPRDIPEKYKWISWLPDDYDKIIPSLERILPVCAKRIRPLILPKTFSAVSEDERKAHAVSALARGYKSFQPGLPHDRHAILCCYGPSLRDTAWEIHKMQGDVFTVSGAHDFIVNLGINIHGHVESDPRPHKAKLICKPQAGTKFYMAACCHPDVFDRLQGYDVELWHPMNSERTDEIVREIDPTGFIVDGGTNVGHRAMMLLAALGYRKFTVFGMDCSFSFSGEQHAGFHSGKKQRLMKVYLPDGAWYWTSPQMIQSCEDFFNLMPAYIGAGCLVDIKGTGLLQHRLRLSHPVPLAA